MPRLAPAFASVALAAIFGGSVDAAEPSRVAVAKSPRSPEEEKADFHLAPGLRIDVIASEPQIESPVACAFDERGKLWVVEMRDYPNGPAKGKAPAGRIKVLEDRDGDGRYETATLFAEGLLFANGVLPWQGGAIVTAAPQILFLKDADGDGKADVREVLYEGFAAGNPQLRVSHPVLGPDGWIYVANGLRGGEIRAAGKSDAVPISISGKDFRFDPIRGRAEAIPGPGQFGNTIDSWGRRFVCDNRNHLRHVVFPIDPGVRNPLLAAPSLLEDTAGPADGPLSSGAKVFPLSQNWTTSNLHAGRFTASCGVFADRGSLLTGTSANGLYTCDPTGNLVHMETLSPAGATFRSRPWKEGVEWLASPEEWFRPVSLAQAPDGSLLLVDMYRAVIEHPEFMPPELKNRPDLMLGAERGRIWRIAPQDDAPASQQLALDKLTTPELVEQLAHANGWRRTTAQRLLMAAASSDKANVKNAVAPALIAFAESTKSSEGLTHAGWLLSWLSDGKLDQNNTAIAQRTLRHSDPRVRENAARMWQAALPESPALVEEYRTLAGDADAGVRFQVALALGNLNRDEVTPVLAKIAARDAADRWTRLAVASSSGGRTGKLVAALLADAPGFSGDARPERVRFVQELSELIGSAREPAEVGAVIDALTNRDAVWLRAGLIGLSEGVSRRGASFSAFLATLPGGADRAITALTDATKPAIDPQASPDDRLAAVRLLGHSSWGAAGTALKRLLADEETSFELALAAVQALAAHPQSEVAVALLGKWPAATPALRGAVLDALLRRGEWTTALLDAIESGAVRPGDVDPTRARRLIASTDASIAGRAKSLLRDSLPADRAGVLERYRAALALPADLDRGREVFRKNCAACHSVAGIGTNVGPDVSDTRTKTPEMLLTDVLNPNAAIDGNFISYNVSTRDGRVRTGLIASESASGLVLKRENQQSDVILRADVEEVWSSGMSLMPEGLEKALSVQDAADVIHFLKRWRFADGSVPAGK